MAESSIVESLFNESEPLGPIVAEKSLSSPNRLKEIFDDQNDLFHQLNHQRSIIVGRKGSGKTTLLNSVSILESNAIVIYLESADIFSQIVEQVDEVSVGTEFVEQIGRLWEVLLWSLVFAELVKISSDRLLSDYLNGLGVSSNLTPYEMIDVALNTVAGFPPTAKPVPQKIAYTRINNISYMEARNRACEILDEHKARAYILMDSLEDFKLHIEAHATAISGLLRCIGDFSEFSDRCILRCCLPAEKYFDFERISTNPLKDFRGQILLHWRSIELVQMAAKRYAKYLGRYEPDFYRLEVASLNLSSRDDLHQFWDQILPDEIRNRNGVVEKPLAYALRHTQLLPRHFLVILTEILSYAIKVDKTAYAVSEEAVIHGINMAEDKIQQQIIEAYSSPFRSVQEACEVVLRDLPTKFGWSEFDEVAARAKGKIYGIENRTDLMSLLTEIGAVGRLVRETDKYFEAVFEYMVPHRLIVSTRDEFCIHPVFTEVYNANSEYLGSKPVYTYWSKIVHDKMDIWT